MVHVPVPPFGVALSVTAPPLQTTAAVVVTLIVGSATTVIKALAAVAEHVEGELVTMIL